MKPLPLEDTFADIIQKAQRGLQISDEHLSEQAGISLDRLNALRAGTFDEESLRRISPVLRLRGDALVTLAQGQWLPRDPGEVPGLARFTSPCGQGLHVHAYLVWDEATLNGVCFDTGTDASEMLQFAAEREIRIQMVLLTHRHTDHFADLGRLCERTGAKAFISKQEKFPGAETFDTGHNFTVGNLRVGTKPTPGHSRGGVTYVIAGLPVPVAVVGDSLFAGSIGAGLFSYAQAIASNCEKILTLPENTLLCPGHGPFTTVGEEKEHNPFFPQVAE